MKNQTYEEFYLKYRKISKAYAYGILHDWNMADDVSQDVLYKMYNMRKGLNVDNEKMMYSLIRRSSVNKAMDYKKKSSSRHEFVCTEDISEILEVRRSVDAEEVILRKEKKEFMYMVLERFREEQPLNYEILIQVKYLDIPVEIVAEEFGLRIKRNPAISWKWQSFLQKVNDQERAHSSISSVILLIESTRPFPAMASVYF